MAVTAESKLDARGTQYITAYLQAFFDALADEAFYRPVVIAAHAVPGDEDHVLRFAGGLAGDGLLGDLDITENGNRVLTAA